MIAPVRIAILVSILVYFIFDYFDGRQVKDERENLIELKTFALVQRVTMYTLTVMATIYYFQPDLNAFYPIAASVVAALYTEIIGKVYFRRQI